MEHFRKESANRHQWDHRNSYALSAVNALALAERKSWEEAYGLLLDACEAWGLMPENTHCVKTMLCRAGYVRVLPFHRLKTYADLHIYLTEHFPGITRGIAATAVGGDKLKRLCAIRREEDQEGRTFTALDNAEETRDILSLWLSKAEAGLAAAPDVPGQIKASPAGHTLIPHRTYVPFQPNPKKNNIGDCVIRAYAAVFGVSWAEAMRMLAKSCEYATAELNSRHMFAYLTSEYGMTYHEPLMIDGKGSTGAQLCDWLTLHCRQGERIFAKVGATHVAGIVPVGQERETHYAILDSWDSSGERFGGFWIYTPRQNSDKKATTKEETVSTHPTNLESGMPIWHPAFGKGEVLRLEEDGRVTLSFPKAGEKLLAITWVQENCKTTKGL